MNRISTLIYYSIFNKNISEFTGVEIVYVKPLKVYLHHVVNRRNFTCDFIKRKIQRRRDVFIHHLKDL